MVDVYKRQLFYILNSVYNEQELAILFSSLTEQSSRFKEQILENYLSAKNVGELASLLGYGVTNFRAKFKEQFGVSVYRWLLNRKSQHIIYRITVYGDEFSQIIDDFGFSSPSHLDVYKRQVYKSIFPTFVQNINLGQMTESERKQIIALIQREVIPAIGCTEPIAVALCVAKATETLGAKPEKIKVLLSANILKNAMGVGIPGTGMIGRCV